MAAFTFRGVLPRQVTPWKAFAWTVVPFGALPPKPPSKIPMWVTIHTHTALSHYSEVHLPKIFDGLARVWSVLTGLSRRVWARSTSLPTANPFAQSDGVPSTQDQALRGQVVGADLYIGSPVKHGDRITALRFLEVDVEQETDFLQMDLVFEGDETVDRHGPVFCVVHLQDGCASVVRLADTALQVPHGHYFHLRLYIYSTGEMKA